MITITVPGLGLFSGEDERAAMAAVRKAKRAAATESRRRDEASSLAYDAAALRGFRILDHAWGARAGRTRLSNAWYLAAPHVVGTGVAVRCGGPFGGHLATYEGVEYDHGNERVVDVLVDSLGWVMAVITRPCDAPDDSRDEVVAVGTADGLVALRRLRMTGAELRELISTPRIEREDVAAE
jgi:tRNA splicing endonuclease